MKGIIYLEDGTIYKGKGFGAEATRVGELVFNTAMTGYQKTLTDPSYKEQIITMTYPLLGNYGVNETDYESEQIHAFGVVCQDVCFSPSNWKSVMNIDQWLKEQKVPGVYDVDTREITRKLRRTGNQKCVITTENLSMDAIRRICMAETLNTDQMKTAGVRETVTWEKPENSFNVAVLDFGVKRSILQELFDRGCNLTIYPYGTKARTILAAQPDGVFLTNGPGDPESAQEAVTIIEKLITNSSYGPKQMPIFGICMGHQLIALACGGSTYKLKYGHRGCNHGVFDKDTGRSYITSQNHGYAVRAESIVLKGLEVTHLNLNDGTVEGMAHLSKPVFSVQFHPESSPGPCDTGYLFDKFIHLMKGGRL
ncbi:MAG: glutamine-hydrolyzing carbamoyl-phosphate synthase small subunit [Emergencia sp.]